MSAAEGKRKSKKSKKSQEPKAKRVKTLPVTANDRLDDENHEKVTQNDEINGADVISKKEKQIINKTAKKSKISTRETKEDPSRTAADPQESGDDRKAMHLESHDSTSDSDDGDDDELLAAAAAWAQRDESPAPSTSPAPSGTAEGVLPKNDLSLHITQLPYDANELDLRRLFAEQGCRLSSIRLVFDRDDKGRKTVFRGVAFVDLIDRESYDKALSLNRKSPIRGRKLNIRPTKSKQELASIVIRTRELVQEKIQKQREIVAGGVDGDTTPGKNEKKDKKKAKKKDSKEKAKAKAVKAKPTKSKAELEMKKDGSPTANGEKKEPHKLTKKERNRRAAILASMKRKSK